MHSSVETGIGGPFGSVAEFKVAFGCPLGSARMELGGLLGSVWIEFEGSYGSVRTEFGGLLGSARTELEGSLCSVEEVKIGFGGMCL